MTTILVIDDDAHIRLLLQKMLQRAGYRVIAAADGNEGINQVRANAVDLVITDIIMPDKEGIETILELQRDFPDIKIIAISGGGRIGAPQILETARHFGVTHTFTKPLCRNQLLEAIQALLSIPAPDPALQQTSP